MFFEFGIKDFIDILLVAFLLYYTYKLMKASGSINVFTGILVFILIWLVVSQVLEMKLLGSLASKPGCCGRMNKVSTKASTYRPAYVQHTPS